MKDPGGVLVGNIARVIDALNRVAAGHWNRAIVMNCLLAIRANLSTLSRPKGRELLVRKIWPGRSAIRSTVVDEQSDATIVWLAPGETINKLTKGAPFKNVAERRKGDGLEG